jgi:hypothetical protein
MADDDNVGIEYDEEEEYESEGEDEGEEDFLADMGVDRYPPAAPAGSEKDAARQVKADARELKQIMLEQQRAMKRQAREDKADAKERAAESKRAAKRADKGEAEADELFSNEGTPIMGKNKLVLLKKVQQYKTLFPAELKAFKVKKNPSEKDLADALAEMEVLVEVNGVDGFLLDGVLQSIKLVEGASSYTQYDIRGCADLLKSNKQFHSLCKQLFVKYNVFSSVPAEYQLLLLVSTTAYICSNKNRGKAQINAYLDEPV